MQLYELSAICIKIGFLATFITNAFFITLTIFYAKNIAGTYRKMLVIFATTCILFSAFETIVQPSLHNFNGGAVYFSLNSSTWLSLEFQTVALIVYASCYVAQLVFIAIQFLFRYVTLIQHPMEKSFHGRLKIFWMLYFFGIGTVYGFIIYIAIWPDEYSDQYLQKEMFKVYGKNISEIPRLMEVPYDEEGNIRWKIIGYFCSELLIFDSQYAIIIFCALKMRKAMKTQLNKMSTRNRKLERQFFKALTVQILLPTFLITIPIGSVLLLPLLDLKISFQSGVIFAMYSLYPPLDSIATMVIIKEYRSCLGDFWKDFGIQRTLKPEQSSGNTLTMRMSEISAPSDS